MMPYVLIVVFGVVMDKQYIPQDNARFNPMQVEFNTAESCQLAADRLMNSSLVAAVAWCMKR